MFFYSDTGSKKDLKINVWELDAVKCYLSHYSNFLFLDFMLSKGTYLEQVQARKEIEICEKKLAWWKKHPTFNEEAVNKEKERMHKEWKYNVVS